ncbi:hypothetical protein KKA02_04575, partial [Patescibacteria group bacterium]|nr:hypothetical protein [Patescibacteria group bacterium]
MMGENIADQISRGVFLLVILTLVLILLGFCFYVFVLWCKWRDREKRSLDLVTLLLAVPDDNEIKIDSMEQVISSFGNMY